MFIASEKQTLGNDGVDFVPRSPEIIALYDEYSTVNVVRADGYCLRPHDKKTGFWHLVSYYIFCVVSPWVFLLMGKILFSAMQCTC